MTPDPAHAMEAVEAVAKALYDETDSGWSSAKRCATPVIAALSALGWVEGHRHAAQLDAVIREAVRADQAETKLAAVICERDALRAALELIAAPVRADGTYNRCREACEVVARDAITAAKGTP